MAVKTYKKGDTTKLSKNFSVYEFRCGIGGPCSCTTTLVDEKLVEYLQAIREHFGAPVTITSAYRCESYNRSIGGAVGSRHTKGQAADISVAGVAPRKVAAFAESLGVKGIGLYETAADGYFVHIDTRTAKSFWYGQAEAPRSTFGGSAAAGKPATSPTAPTAPSTSTNSYTLRQFIEDVQKACGAPVDGEAGQKTLAATVTISAKKNISHPVVEAVQRRLLALGYTDTGKADGVAGPKFDKALRKFQADRGCVQDGEATAKAKTWRVLLEMK